MANNNTKYFVINPNYTMYNDENKVVLTSNNIRSLDNDFVAEFISFFPSEVAMVLSFFTGKDTYQQSIEKIAYFLDSTIAEVVDFIDKYICNPESFTTSSGNYNLFIPKNLIIECTDDSLIRNFTIEEFVLNSSNFKSQPRLNKPLGTTFVISNKCVTDCEYCYADRKTKYTPLTTNRIKELIHQAAELGIRDFDLSGGEFFLHPDWDEILETLIYNGYYPYISTKKPINEKDVNKLKSLGVKRIQYSLDSVNIQKLMDTLKVGENYLEAISNSIRLLENADIKVRINGILSNKTAEISDIEDLIIFLQDFSNIEKITLTPAGRSLYKEGYSYSINKKQVQDIDAFLKEKNKDLNRVNIDFGSFVLEDHYKLEDKSGLFNNRATCSGNFSHFIILPDGKVTICEELYWNENFIIGDLATQNIMDVWQSDKAKNLYYKSQESIQKGSNCARCDDFSKCRVPSGVCWRNIINAYGDDKYDYPDPRCPIAPEFENVFYIQ